MAMCIVRLITRSDTSLSVALIAAAIILFRQPLRYVLDMVQDIEGRYRLDLLPALLLLTIVFTFHQYHKWTIARAEAASAGADAERAREQSRKLQQLMEFGHALANALDRATLQQVLWKHFPTFASNRDFWVFVRETDKWELVVQDGNGVLPTVERLREVAAHAMSGTPVGSETARSAGLGAGFREDACFPLLASGDIVGAIGIGGDAPLTIEQRNLIGAAATLMA